MDKQIIIDDQKKTIHRLQDECTEKTNAIIALGEQLKAKDQECEELKDKLKIYEKMMDNPDYKVDEYKKALEEVEEYFSLQDTTRTSLFNIHCIEQEIKNIINKAKGERNV